MMKSLINDAKRILTTRGQVKLVTKYGEHKIARTERDIEEIVKIATRVHEDIVAVR